MAQRLRPFFSSLLGPTARGNVRYVVAITQAEGQTLSLYVTHTNGDGTLAAPTTVSIPGASSLANSEPGL